MSRANTHAWSYIYIILRIVNRDNNNIELGRLRSLALPFSQLGNGLINRLKFNVYSGVFRIYLILLLGAAK